MICPFCLQGDCEVIRDGRIYYVLCHVCHARGPESPVIKGPENALKLWHERH